MFLIQYRVPYQNQVKRRKVLLVHINIIPEEALSVPDTVLKVQIQKVPYQTQVRGRGVPISITPEVALSIPGKKDKVLTLLLGSLLVGLGN